VNSTRMGLTRLIARARSRTLGLDVTAAALALVLAGNLASANPTGPQIVAGQVSVAGAGKQLTVTNSPGSIINWQSFSIAPGELTRFVQQNASSSVLNRITGQNPSQILGALQSNGKVFLINPNGIVFGANSRVDVNGLVASSLNLSDADFLAGKFKFSDDGNAGRVRNEGAITTPNGGQVYLIAPDVTNSGLITTPGGDVLLAAGHSVTLGDSHDPDIAVVVSAAGDQALNVGRIVANSGRVGIYGALVDQNGAVSANSAVMGIDGKIILKSSDVTSLGAGSTTTAIGAGSGGSVQILGPRISLTGDAMVNASGATGGGTVLIGGDLHGGNPSVENALLTSVGSAVRIDADALRSGNGGQVVVWSNQRTQMDGQISARGGAAGGDGGFVETSSKGLLDFEGRVDLRAPRGAAGTLLLDPSDINIQFGDTSGDVTVPGTAPFTITATQPTSFLSTQTLESELLLGNVTVSTTSGAAAPLGGTISVNSAVTWANANQLTLAADQSVIIRAPISGPMGTLVLTAANGSITQTLNNSPAAAISVAGLSVSAPQGAVTLTEPTNQITGPIAGVASQGFALVNSAGIAVGTVGNLAGIDAGTSAVTLTSAGTVTTLVGAIKGSTLQISAVGGVGSTQAPLNTSVGALQVTNVGGGDIAVSNTGGALAIADIGALGYGIEQSASGNIVIASDNQITVNGAIQILGSVGSIGLHAANGIALSALISAPSANGTVALESDAGDIVQTGSISAAAVSAVAPQGSVQLMGSANAIGTIAGAANGSQGFALTDGTGVTVGTAPAVGTLAAVTGITSAAAPGGGVTLQTANAGDITIASAVNAGNAPVVLNAAGAVQQGTGGLISAGSLSATAGSATGIGSAAAPLLTHVGTLANATSQGPMYLSNATDITIDAIQATGVVNVNAAGSLSTPNPQACACKGSIAGASVTLTASGAMNLAAGSSVSATKAIALYAGYDAAAGTYAPPGATLTAAGTLSAPSIALFSGGPIDATGTMTGLSTQMPFLAPGAAPTLTQCIAAPTLAGCAGVLPSVAQCTATPSTPGCSVVLPTLAQCTAAPATAGCSVVLPTVAQCSAAPTTSGCSVVLPTLAQCTAAPTLAGCGTVLPSVATCTVTPGAVGCAAVLPTTNAGSNASPLVQASTLVISTVTMQVNTLIDGAGSIQPGASSSTSGKSADSTAAKNTTTNTATTNDAAAKKLYCN
jgi:filamentous hemagglutinin family protein